MKTKLLLTFAAISLSTLAVASDMQQQLQRISDNFYTDSLPKISPLLEQGKVVFKGIDCDDVNCTVTLWGEQSSLSTETVAQVYNTLTDLGKSNSVDVLMKSVDSKANPEQMVYQLTIKPAK